MAVATSQAPLAADARSWWPELVAAATAVALTIAVRGTRLDTDVSWQIWIAHHLARGARFGIDIVETNPPLWFWMAMPIDRAAGLMGVAVNPLMVAAVGSAVFMALIATGRLLLPLRSRRRAPLLVYGAALLLVMPLPFTGQREHLALIAAWPYAALITRRRSDVPVAPWAAAAVGIGAVLGFALKHYFLFVPVLLETWLIAGLGGRWRPVRPEVVAMLATGLVYAGLVLVLTPAYFTKIVPMVELAYGQTSVTALGRMIQPTQWIWLATLVLLLAATSRRKPGGSFADAMFVAALGFGAAWLIQRKGWPYQAIATTGCLSMALAARLAEAGTRPRSIVRLLAPAVLILPIALTLVIAAQPPGPPRPDLVGLKPGDGAAFISADPASAWPAVSEYKLENALRYNGFWMLNAIVASEHGRPDTRLAALGRQITRETDRDIRCAQPRRIVFDRPDGANPRVFDTFRFFMRDPGFATTLAHYRHHFRAGATDVFDRATALPPIAPALCRQGV